MAKLQGTRLGAIRVYYFGVLIMLAAFLFGYDTGIVGGVVTLKSYQTSFGFDADDTKVNSLVVGLQQLAAFVTACFIAPVTDRFGRKWVLVGSSVVFCAGVVLQVVPSHMLRYFYAGRLISGFGLGAAYCITPIYSVEMMPKEIRGQMGACFQWLYTWGVLLSYWIDYGVLKGMPSSDMQWQIPVGIQMIPAGLLGIGVLFQPESVRWLLLKGREQQAWTNLKWIRADDGDEVKMEFGEMRMGVVEEIRATEGFRKRELWEPANRRRLTIACVLFMNVQLTGSSALAYFGPQFFASIVGKGDRNLLITALFGVIKVVACTAFIFFMAERFSRRIIFIAGALAMSACMLIVAVLNKEYPPATGEPKVTSAGIGMVAIIFLDIMIYNMSWGPLPHPYVSEIFPTRIRAIGVCFSGATQWLFNFTFSLVPPYMIKSMGWGTFLFFALTDLWSAAFSYFLLKETRNRSLEEMETIFESKAAFDVEYARREALSEKNVFENEEDAERTIA